MSEIHLSGTNLMGCKWCGRFTTVFGPPYCCDKSKEDQDIKSFELLKEYLGMPRVWESWENG